MSIDRIKGQIAFICDNCDEGLETEQSDFGVAREVLRDEGWIVRNLGDVWEHFCSRECWEAAR